MADYRMVARHVRYWRGAVHRWSTVYQFVGTLATSDQAAVITALKTLENAIGFQNPSSAATGGLYEIALYNSASGGVPINLATYFDWTTPASWLPYLSTAWATSGRTFESAAEVAMAVRWPAGFSRTGKPVYFRKWYHSVPTASGIGTRDITAPDVTSIKGAIDGGIASIEAKGILLGKGSRLAATGCTVELFYENHQMPRGRRKKISSASVPSGAAVQGPFKILLD